ncbi:MAG: serine/threonine protein kinase [Rhodobacteraceae bacterium]|nr:serine/threonine protein kinase [Paracoccaceae bacterium]
MSTLPYGSPASRGWLAAACSSLAVHAALGALLLGGLQPLIGRFAPQTTPPQVRVTLQRLDSDTLAGLTLQDGLAGAEAQAESDPLSPQIAHAADDISDLADPAGNKASGMPASAAQPAQQDPGLHIAAPTPAAEAASPLLPAETGPLVPETLAPVASSGTAVSTATVNAGLTTLQPLAALPGAQSGTPEKPAAAKTPPPPRAQDLAVKDLISRIRANGGPDCLLALPRRDGADSTGLEMLAARDAAFGQFSEAVLGENDNALRQTRTLLDPRQCPAAEYIRRNRDYPATRLGLRLDSGRVASGGRLTGVLRGTAGKYVALLLVDNNGVVQDLQRFLTQTGNVTRFDVPVTLAGPVRDTAQMLIAIGSTRPLQQIRSRDGRLAQDVFTGLTGDLTGSAALAVAAFDIR